MRLLKTLVSLALLTGAGMLRAQTVYDNLSTRPTGKIHFNSVTPKSRFDLARGSYDRKPTVVWGWLTMPISGDGPFPAMVLAHGSGGIEAKDMQRWVPLFRKMGVAVFVVDSFSPRGIDTTVDDQSQLDQSANDADALSALKLLATDPRIDPKRIGVIGFSRGGVVALETGIDRFRRGVIDGDLKFAAHIPFYPGCGMRYWTTPSPMTGAPIMMALGEIDNYTLARPCVEYARVMKEAGQDIELHVYPNAHHDFDNPTPQLVDHPEGQSTRDCPDREIDPITWEYRMLKTGRKFRDYKSFSAAVGKCMAYGVTSGGNEVAAKQAEADVRAFVMRVLKP